MLFVMILMLLIFAVFRYMGKGGVRPIGMAATSSTAVVKTGIMNTVPAVQTLTSTEIAHVSSIMPTAMPGEPISTFMTVGEGWRPITATQIGHPMQTQSPKSTWTVERRVTRSFES